jgi:glycerophosphoryl diester phosphodiesterase
MGMHPGDGRDGPDGPDGPERHRVLISAHRGGAETHPAATWEAYDDALEAPADQRADYVELDIRKLGDGALVVHHDAYTPEGRKLAALSYPQLCRQARYEVPLVEPLLERIGAGPLQGHLDLKETGYEAEVITTARRHLGEEFIVTSLADESIRAIKTGFPPVRAALSLGLDVRDLSRSAALAIRYRELFPRRRILHCRADGIAAHQRIARLRGLSLAAEMGILALVWTVDEERRIDELLRDPRVGILVTNRPRLAVAKRAGLDPGARA